MERLVKYATIISGLLIFLGFVSVVSYYGPFDIDVWTYLSAGELLLAFLPHLIDFIQLMFGALLIIWLFALDHRHNLIEFAERTVKKVPVMLDWIKGSRNYMERREYGNGFAHLLIGVGIYMVVPMVMFWYLMHLAEESVLGTRMLDSPRLWRIVDYFWLPLFAFVLYRKYVMSKTTTWKYICASSILMYVVLRVAAEGHIAANDVIAGRTIRTVSIVTKDDSVLTTDSVRLKYIGKCNAAVFLLDDQTVKVLPMDQIKELDLGMDRMTIIRNDRR